MVKEEKLIKGINYWPGCGISFDELIIMLDKEPKMTEEEARKYLESLFNKEELE